MLPNQSKQEPLSKKRRAAMALMPYKYFNEPSIATRDCCLCCHETEEKLNISPLVEIGGTWLSPTNPVNKTFVFLRFIVMLYVVYCAVFSFVLYAKHGHYAYYFMYFTQWNALLASALMIIKCISSFRVYRYHIHELNGKNMDTNSSIWKWYTLHKIFLQISLPSITVVVVNYWLLVYSGPGHFPDENSMLSSLQTHAFSCCALWIDFVFSAERLYYKSAIYPVLLGTMYTLWSIIFECTLNMNEENDPYLYEVYNWSEHQIIPTITFIASTILITIVTFIIVFIKNLILMKTEIYKLYNPPMQIEMSDQEALI